MTQRDELYAAAAREFGRSLDRLAAGYEADPEKRRDLRQEIQFQLWRSLEGFDGRCSLKTWTFRVANNVSTSYVTREARLRARFVALEEIEATVWEKDASTPDLDRQRSIERLSELIRKLKPLDRQIMLAYLEQFDLSSIAEITGLSAANVAMKVHRIKNILARRFHEETEHA
jgi:RNA polymerase sigma-70 factor, ECF subfamily